MIQIVYDVYYLLWSNPLSFNFANIISKFTILLQFNLHYKITLEFLTKKRREEYDTRLKRLLRIDFEILYKIKRKTRHLVNFVSSPKRCLIFFSFLLNWLYSLKLPSFKHCLILFMCIFLRNWTFIF